MAVEAARARAPCASAPGRSRGRLHPEPVSATRNAFRRDCDRIIHATAFRRLAHKTQVFVFHEGDHCRTRLTHALEVAQIARSLARALGLDEDLAEALALAHDLGHPPFGHAGERALDRCLEACGGFDHNAQTLRVVTALERRYAAFDGLNLTWETLEGLVRHNGPLVARSGAPAGRYRGGLAHAIRAHAKRQELVLSSDAAAAAQVGAFSAAMAAADRAVKDFLLPRMYRHDRVMRIMTEAEGVVADLFTHYATHPADLPAEWAVGLDTGDDNARLRRIADFIAGMTDRYALVEHARLFAHTPDLR